MESNSVHGPWPAGWKEKLPIPALPKDGSELDCCFDLDIDSLSHWGLVYTFPGPLSFAVSASRHGARILMSVKVAGGAEFPCSRCLAPAGADFDGAMDCSFRLGPPADGEPEDDDIVELDRWAEHIDLAPYCWEAFITALPAGGYCKEDCAGICPVCGADRNNLPCMCAQNATDPRLEALKGFIAG